MEVDTSIVKEEIDIDDTKIKLEPIDDEETDAHALEFSSSERLKIIEERSNMITVSVNEEKSAEELKFIASLNKDLELFEETSYQKVCQFCLASFAEANSFMHHKLKSGCRMLWQAKHKCKVCTLVFKSRKELADHRVRHQLNKHFCRTGCGVSCNTLEQCLEHEYREHAPVHGKLQCRICWISFVSADVLATHMKSHVCVRRFVCALCRRCFDTLPELVQHRSEVTNSCGNHKLVYLSNGSELVAAMPTVTIVPQAEKFSPLTKLLSEKHIKPEPMDTYEQPDQSYQNNLNVTIKSEPVDETELKYKNIYTNGCSQTATTALLSKLRLPSLKRPIEPNVFIKKEPIDSDIAIPKDIKCVPMDKLKSVPTAGPVTVAGGSNILKVLPSNCMLIKLPPSIRIVKIPQNSNGQQGTSKIVTNTSGVSTTPLTKLTVATLPNTKIVKLPTNPNGISTFQVVNNADIIPSLLNGKESAALSNIKSSQDDNQVQAIKKRFVQVAERNRTACFSTDACNLMENLPDSRKIIEDLQNQIRKIEKDIPMPGTVLQQMRRKQAALDKANLRKSFDLPITSGNEAKDAISKKFPGYDFQWMCKFCNKTFVDITLLRTHLETNHKFKLQANSKVTVELRGSKANDESDDSLPVEPTACDEEKKPKVEPKIEPSALKEEIEINKEGKVLTVALPKSQSPGAPTRSKFQRAECNECHKTFTTASALSVHKLIHTGELPFKCEYCDKRFRTRPQVRVHHRRHTGEKPFKCKVCLLAFTHRETLISHLSRHIGMKRYKCYGCNSYFVVVSGLRAHRRNRPDTCGKVKFTARAHGPRVRVIRGEVVFEPHPDYNGYLRSEDPMAILSEIKQPPTDNDES